MTGLFLVAFLGAVPWFFFSFDSILDGAASCRIYAFDTGIVEVLFGPARSFDSYSPLPAFTTTRLITPCGDVFRLGNGQPRAWTAAIRSRGISAI
jgi:hypothetical protein